MRTVYSAMVAAYPEVYKLEDHYHIGVTRIHDQINSSAKTIFWVLFAASGLLFVIASSNVANLVLARAGAPGAGARRALRVGSGPAVLRRSLLAESLVLCGSGAVGGQFFSRFRWSSPGSICGAVFRARKRDDARFQPGVVRRRARFARCCFSGIHPPASLHGHFRSGLAWPAAEPASQGSSRRLRFSLSFRSRLRSSCWPDRVRS